jgi:hypothetical protein
VWWYTLKISALQKLRWGVGREKERIIIHTSYYDKVSGTRYVLLE